jgi:vancomycin resistance protein YoaR
MLRWVLLTALGVGIGVGAGVGIHAVWPEGPIARGVFVGGRQLPRGVSPSTWLAEEEARLGEREVVVRWSDGEVTTNLRTLGFRVDHEATLARAVEVAHRGPLGKRLYDAHLARQGQVDVPLAVQWSQPTLDGFLDTLASRLARDPVDARLDVKRKLREADVPGRELDREGARAAVKSLDLEWPGVLVVDVSTLPIAAKLTLAHLADIDVTKVVASYETKFSPHVVGRAANVHRAAELIDGVILPPGATLSFNETVGPRTLARGFSLAPEIQGDELTTGVGGGTCQVSSTLFSAAVFGALEIVERKSHSQVSSYAKMGLDATVSYPTTDLKLKNPLPFAIAIHTSFPQRNVLRVELLGGDPPAEVSYSYGVSAMEAFVRRITVKESLAPGTRLRKQKGSRGFEVTSKVVLRFRDGRVEERLYHSGYRPAPEVYWVAPGYDESQLPPLPDHALGVEGRIAVGTMYDDEADSSAYSPMTL